MEPDRVVLPDESGRSAGEDPSVEQQLNQGQIYGPDFVEGQAVRAHGSQQGIVRQKGQRSRENARFDQRRN